MTEDLSHWTPRAIPSNSSLEGRSCRLETIREDHLPALFEAYAVDATGSIWDYLPYGPFESFDAFERFAKATYFGADPHFHVLIRASDEAVLGVASLMRIVPQHGVIEVGHINYAAHAQRSIMTTEALYLFARQAFDELGYRRFEWKCNDANAASKRAAIRFGFMPEGVHRQLMVVKGRNRDTAWFSMLDHEWPGIKAAFERWLDRDNFDSAGQQKTRLDTWAHREDARPAMPE
jgi:RimJ/RimL family protein N-acetyltransferase